MSKDFILSMLGLFVTLAAMAYHKGLSLRLRAGLITKQVHDNRVRGSGVGSNLLVVLLYSQTDFCPFAIFFCVLAYQWAFYPWEK